LSWAAANIPGYRTIPEGADFEVLEADGTHRVRYPGGDRRTLSELWETGEYIKTNLDTLKEKYQLDTAPVDRRKFAALAMQTKAYSAMKLAAALDIKCRMEFEDIHRVLGDLLDDRPADFQLLLLKNLREMRAEMKASETVNTLTKKQVNEINNCLEQSGIVGRL